MKLLPYAVWRHVLGKNDVVDQLSLSLGKCKSNPFLIFLTELIIVLSIIEVLAISNISVRNFFISDVLTLSSQGSVLRAWNLPDGQMVWETDLQISNPTDAFLHILVFCRNFAFLCFNV
jgi:ER membrane protein complex subunit 1